MVPHFVTALKGPLLDFEKKILDATSAIERWFRLEWQEHTPPFYCSVNLRNAGFKLALVDTNLFPGGFNNLTSEVLPLAVQAAIAAIEKICPDAKDLLLIPEEKLHNTLYLQNLVYLSTIMRHAGLNVRFGSLSSGITAPTPIELPTGQNFVIEPLERSPRRLGLKNFDPCSILLNNDLAEGVPLILEGLHEQYLLPPLHAGWAVRRRSQHFSSYDGVVKRFSKLIDVDPWMLSLYFAKSENVNFSTNAGGELLVDTIDVLLKKIAKKYREYGISEKPFIILKSNAGAHSMVGMRVYEAANIKNLNLCSCSKTNLLKEGFEMHEVLLQEGVYTFERLNEAVAEPVVYMIDRYVVGGCYRVHASYGKDKNLNTPGVKVFPLSFEHAALPDMQAKLGAAPPNRFYMYGVIARLGLLAASIELERTDPDQETY
ncbi:glutamate--cysteine ligase [Candidatus Pandoraea novymonadis]|uniref:Glutamate--cysteine ligase n=1 Tax=Candidatus Pandoraea novymonadis TaxID=1808959 RepID=A0ABX5FE52_9BURK|nr:glutamate--cysteine ligase [Candidatus Pandoraea novymonadis]PSB91738.1 hypothetical protein BZL35_00780 [Candidatus Pandoraea novymonadis]